MIACGVASVIRRKSGLLRQEEPGGSEALVALEHHVARFDRHRAIPPFQVDSEVLVLRYRRAMWMPHAGHRIALACSAASARWECCYGSGVVRLWHRPTCARRDISRALDRSWASPRWSARSGRVRTSTRRTRHRPNDHTCFERLPQVCVRNRVDRTEMRGVMLLFSLPTDGQGQ